MIIIFMISPGCFRDESRIRHAVGNYWGMQQYRVQAALFYTCNKQNETPYSREVAPHPCTTATVTETGRVSAWSNNISMQRTHHVWHECMTYQIMWCFWHFVHSRLEGHMGWTCPGNWGNMVKHLSLFRIEKHTQLLITLHLNSISSDGVI